METESKRQPDIETQKQTGAERQTEGTLMHLETKTQRSSQMHGLTDNRQRYTWRQRVRHTQNLQRETDRQMHRHASKCTQPDIFRDRHTDRQR